MVDEFWKLWIKDYVAGLQARPKWRNSTPDLLVGQLVLLPDDLAYRDVWKRGRIEEVFTDGNHVRKALV